MNDKVNPSEINYLKRWVADNMAGSGHQITRWQALSGDASLRRYFRASTEANHSIAVFSPPDSQNNDAFIHIAELLKNAGIRASEVFAFDATQGFMLQQDLGDSMLLDALNEQSVGGWYQKSIAILLDFVAIDREATKALGCYDQDKLSQEMALFHEWFVEKLLGYQCSDAELEMIHRLYDRLSKSALEQPRVFVHRDFHSRNLMITNKEQLAVIDFQDAVMGPVTYDVVSLLKDCYITWPKQQVERWVSDFYQHLKQGGVVDLKQCDENGFLYWFHAMGLQRHLKVLGIFARLSIRDQKPGFLQDLPRVINYVLSVCDDDAELSGFADFIREKLLPKARLQDWGKML